jgi:SAM-dependent methyltransferase
LTSISGSSRGVPFEGTSVAAHYDDDYYSWQASGAEDGALANRGFFQPFIKPSDDVVDFGCGGGFLLDAIACARKTGIEINPAARRVAATKFTVVADFTEVDEGSADVVISSHALEHTYDPFEKVRLCYRTLKPGGLAIFVVPCERYDTAYRESNIDQHLYTWSPVNLGNLFRHAGFTVVACERLVHRFPPGFALLRRRLGERAFHIVCFVYAWLFPKLSQIRIVVRKDRHAPN